ncbi:hypothetical protein [Carboxylicivirga sp. RSCT41]|uniref:hypothetical protein n=1 Tax=Carboxylicivirga agarovorans TaxID=3417570 RepID=UPI003D353156
MAPKVKFELINTIFNPMDNHSTEDVSVRTDQELIEILENRFDYSEKEFKAALGEVERRRKVKVSNARELVTEEKKTSETKERKQANYKTRVIGENNISQSNPANSFYLFSLIGGFVRWILFEEGKGKELYEIVNEENKYKNSLVFLILLLLIIAVLSLFGLFFDWAQETTV